MKKIAAVFATIFFASQASCSGSYHAKYQKHMPIFIETLIEIFDKNGICKNKKECREKEILFFAPGSEFLHIAIYQINSMQAVENIVVSILSSYRSEEMKISVELEIFGIQHRTNSDYLSTLLNPPKPIATFTIKGEK